MNPIKLALSRVFDASGLNSVLLRLQWALSGPHVRAVGYHDTPAVRADELEEQLRDFSTRYVDVGRSELEEVLAGRWKSDRPGLLISFDDGLRSHFEVAAPLLEKYGLTGWFMVPAGFVEAPEEEQVAYAAEHDIIYADDYPDARRAISWHQLRRLSARHVICCHSMTHRRLASSLSSEELDHEIRASKRLFEEKLGYPMDIFTWVGGEEWSYSAEAAGVIRDAGYTLCFMTNNAPITAGTDPLQLQRTNIESDLTLPVLRFQLSGFMDAMYTGKRRRVNRLTSA